jgi:hypothetical protein
MKSFNENGLGNWLTNSMEQSPSGKANSCWVKSLHFMEPRPLPPSRGGPYPEPLEPNPHPPYLFKIHFNILTSSSVSFGLSLFCRFPGRNHPYKNRRFHEQIIFIDVISGDQENLSYGTRRFVIRKPSIEFYPEPAHSNLHPQDAFV